MKDLKKELRLLLKADALASGRSNIHARIFGDEIWKFQVSLRNLEYYSKVSGISRFLQSPLRVWHRLRYHSLSLKLGYSIPLNVFDSGLCIVHRGTIVVSKEASVGKNCRIHEGVTIGATNGNKNAAIIGNNVFIGAGAKIIGALKIADNVAIGANAVVVHSITEPGTTWAGVPAKKVSDHSSRENLDHRLML